MTDDAKASSTPEGPLPGIATGDFVEAMVYTAPKVTAQNAAQHAQVQQDTEIKAMIFTSPKVTAQNVQQVQVQPETPKKE